MNYIVIDFIKIKKKFNCHSEEKDIFILMEPMCNVKWNIESKAQNFQVVSELKNNDNLALVLNQFQHSPKE